MLEQFLFDSQAAQPLRFGLIDIRNCFAANIFGAIRICVFPQRQEGSMLSHMVTNCSSFWANPKLPWGGQEKYASSWSRTPEGEES